MGCLTEEVLLSLVAGSLPGQQREAALDHLASCDECRRVAAGLSEARPALRVAPGAAVGRYTAGPLLGSGAMGVVYQARDEALGRDVALKLLRGDLHAGREGFAERLLREARTLARLSHPGVVAVYDVGQHGDDIFVAMELIRGVTLRRWAEPGRPWREVARVMEGVADALAAAHEAGVIHRDLKPDNVLMGEDGRPRLTDFGLAHADASADEPQGPPPRALLSHTGALIGTPAYMAPEQLAGQKATPLSDQYAFGVTLHEVLLGRRPVEARTLDELRLGAERERWRGASMRGLPSWLRAIVARTLRARPEQRFASMHEAAAALRRGLAPRRWPWAAAAAAALSLGALAARPAPCGDLRGAAGGLWDGPSKSKVQAALSRVKPARAPQVFASVDRALAAYDAALARGRLDACLATHVQRDQSGALLDARVACLDRRLREARELVVLLGGADELAFDRAADAVAALPAVADCRDRSALASIAPVPPALRPQAARLEERLASLRARKLVTSPEAWQQQAQGLLPEVERLGHPGLLARAQLMAGAPPWPRPELLEGAAASALRARDDAALADAWIALTEAHARGGRVEEAGRWASLARAALGRLDAPGSRLGQLEFGLFIAHASWTTDLTRAEEHLRRARDEYEKSLGKEHPMQGQIEGGFGYIASILGDHEATLRHSQEALRLTTERLGDGTYGAEASRQNAAVALIHLGREREGIESLEGILARWPSFAFVRVDIATGLRRLGKHGEALAHDQLALEGCARLRHDECVAFARLGLGEDWLGLGRPDLALAALEQAERAPDIPPLERALTLVALAEALQKTRDDPPRRRALAARAEEILVALDARGGRRTELARARAAGR